MPLIIPFKTRREKTPGLNLSGRVGSGRLSGKQVQVLPKLGTPTIGPTPGPTRVSHPQSPQPIGPTPKPLTQNLPNFSQLLTDFLKPIPVTVKKPVFGPKPAREPNANWVDVINILPQIFSKFLVEPVIGGALSLAEVKTGEPLSFSIPSIPGGKLTNQPLLDAQGTKQSYENDIKAGIADKEAFTNAIIKTLGDMSVLVPFLRSFTKVAFGAISPSSLVKPEIVNQVKVESKQVRDYLTGVNENISPDLKKSITIVKEKILSEGSAKQKANIVRTIVSSPELQTLQAKVSRLGKILGVSKEEANKLLSLYGGEVRQAPVGNLPGTRPTNPNPAFGLSTQEVEGVGRAPVFKGFEDTTTKVLTRLEGKSITSKQEILDLTNMPELKQAERNLIREVAESYPPGKIPVQEFADKVKTQLLPLEISDTAGTNAKSIQFAPDDNVTRSDLLKFENITLPSEIRGNVADYDEVIYQSPIQNSAGGEHFNIEDVPNYFAHTRIEDLTIPTRRVIEIQSDLFQKGRLERESAQAREILSNPTYKPENQANFRNPEARQFIVDEAQRRLDDVNQLSPYRNTWHERIIREEVKRAAQDGKTKLQFPVGETIMKIEKLGDTRRFSMDNPDPDGITSLVDVRISDLRVGLEVADLGTDAQRWIITDVLEDGKFKAGPLNALDAQNLSDKDILKWFKDNPNRTETFDISGKVDTKNPIYKFYEKDIGKFLKNKYGAKLITDLQGVKWWEVDVDKSLAEAPVEAFKKTKSVSDDVAQVFQNEGLKLDLTLGDARAKIKELFPKEGEIDLVFQEELIGSRNGQALGQFIDRAFNNPLIRLVQSGGMTSEFLLYHEAGHGYFRLFTSKTERARLLRNTNRAFVTLPGIAIKRARYKTWNLSIEEYIMDDFARFVEGKTHIKENVSFYKRLLNKIREWIRKLTGLQKFYDRILSVDRSFTRTRTMDSGIFSRGKVVKKPSAIPKDLEPLAKENPQLFKEAQKAVREGKTAEEFVEANREIKPTRKINDLIDNYASGEKEIKKLEDLQNRIGDAQENPKQFSDFNKRIENVEIGNRSVVRQLSKEIEVDESLIIEGLSNFIDIGARRGKKTITDFYKFIEKPKQQLTDIFNQAKQTEVPLSRKVPQTLEQKLQTIDELRTEREFLRETVKNDPARHLSRFANKFGELGEGGVAGGDGVFRKIGDEVVADLGFSDVESARESFKIYQENKLRLDELNKRIRETNPVISRKQSTILEQKIRDISRGIREGAIKTRAEVLETQQQLVGIIRGILPIEEQGKFISTIKNIQTPEQLQRQLPVIKTRISEILNAKSRRDLGSQIDKELKFTKPVKSGDKRVAKFAPEFDKILEELRGSRKLNQTNAGVKLETLQNRYKEGDIIPEMDKIRSRFLSLQENGAKASVELHEQVLNDIQELKKIGEQAKDLDDFLKKVERAERVDEVVAEVTNIRGDLRESGFVGKIQTKILNSYLRGVANIDSFLNGVAGKDIAERYSPELAENRTFTATFKREQELRQEVADIFDLKNERVLPKKFIDLAAEKTILTDLDGIKTEISKLEMMDIYNSRKNPLLEERYDNAFGKEQIERVLDNLSENEKRVADKMMEVVQEYREIYNKRHIEITGRDMGVVENYWPATTENRPNVFDDIRRQGETPSAIKERSASNKLIPEPKNAWFKTLKHINQGEHISHLSKRYEELKRIFTDRKVKKQLINKYGENIYNDLMSHIDAISLNKLSSRLNAVEDVADSVINNWVKAKIVSPTVWARQLGSVSNYADAMPTTGWAAGFVSGTVTPRKTFNFVWNKYPGIGDFLSARFNRGGSEALRDAIQGANHLQKNKNSWTALLTLPQRASDISAIIYGGAPYLKFLEKEAVRKGLSGEKAVKFIVDSFEKTTIGAQQSPLKTSLSLPQSSPNPLAKLFFRFKNTLNQYLRKGVDATIDFKRGKISGPQFSKTIFLYNVIQPMLYVLIGAGVVAGWKGFWDLVTGEKDRKEKEGVISDIFIQMASQPFSALPLLGDGVNYSLRRMTDKPAYGVISTPVIDDIETAFRKAFKKEPTLEDWLDVLTVPIEAGTGIPLGIFKRYYRYASPKEKGGTSKIEGRELNLGGRVRGSRATSREINLGGRLSR